MPSAILTPFTGRPAESVGNRRWRKLLLPVGDVQYQGRVLKFTKDYLKSLAEAFRAKAYDQTPFQIADRDNAHTNDPERFRGEITDMTVDNSGLWIDLEPTEQGDKLLKINPRLGVSARIIEGYDRSDGKFFPAAIQHVLGTLDPRIPSMGPWSTVEASNMPDVVVDLSNLQFTGEEALIMPELNAEQQAKLARLLDLPQESIEALVQGVQLPDLSDAEIEQLLDEGNGSDGDLSDEELNELLAAAQELDSKGLLEGEPVLTGSSLSNADQMAIELANARADETERQLSVVVSELDQQRFVKERRDLADLGVPPYITDLARPLLEGSGRVVQLSNGGQADAGQIMRRVITEFAKAAQMLDMSIEMGSAMDEPAQHQQADQARGELVGRFRTITGI
jgi:hypothetical protein